MSSFIAHVISEGSQIVDYFEEETDNIEKKRLKDLSKKPVDDKMFKDGLYCLGKTVNNTAHAYLALNISDGDLTSIKGIEKYKHLQTINVSGNNLINLKCLGSIKHLIRLNASNNNIKRMFDFEAPANLEWVDYSHNQITDFENCNRHRYLKNLILDGNQITDIKGLNSNIYLRVSTSHV